MPADAPGTLSDGAYSDTVAFLLRANQISDGAQELDRDLERLARHHDRPAAADVGSVGNPRRRIEMKIIRAGGAAAMALVLALAIDGSAQSSGASDVDQGRASTQLIANERVTVMRLTAAAGLAEEMHITPQDVVAIQAGPGQIEMQIGPETTKGAVGKVWYLPKTVEHALFNRGTEPVAMIVLMLPNGAPPADAAPQAAGGAPARPSRNEIDNERVTVMRVPAPAGMRQEMHKGPQDMVAVQGTAGDIEVAVGSERTKGRLGTVWYLPKTLDHAVFNTGGTPAEMIVVTLK